MCIENVTHYMSSNVKYLESYTMIQETFLLVYCSVSSIQSYQIIKNLFSKWFLKPTLASKDYYMTALLQSLILQQ
jgi:hypothetical protein